MAKKKSKPRDSKRALSGPRLMSIPIEEYIGEYPAGGTSFASYKNWIPSTAGTALMNEGYFDLSGYANDALTLFPTNMGLQDPGYYTTSNVLPTSRLAVLDIISQERLDVDEVEDWWRTYKNVPGMMATTLDFEQIIMGQFRLMTPQTDFTLVGALSSIAGGEFGSGSPTTVQKLWVYRFLIYSAETFENTELEVNATRFNMAATIAEEKELSFLMRQKRSYEISTGQ